MNVDNEVRLGGKAWQSSTIPITPILTSETPMMSQWGYNYDI